MSSRVATARRRLAIVLLLLATRCASDRLFTEEVASSCTTAGSHLAGPSGHGVSGALRTHAPKNADPDDARDETVSVP